MEEASKKRSSGENPLLSSLAEYDPNGKLTGNSPWYAKMQATDPEGYSQLESVVWDFINRGEAHQKLKTLSGLHRWLAKQDVFPKPINTRTFLNWVRMLEAGDV